nr:efflux RND transporter periplasmic adaptor subunit [Deltaproteobacteria bacterium]
MTSDMPTKSNISQILGLEQSQGYRKYMKWLLVLILLIMAGVIIALIWMRSKDSAAVVYQTREVKRGNLVVTVTATGNLEPTDQVDVGTEVSGTIESVEVDYNDSVQVGQVLARLDLTKFEAQVLKSKAALEAAQAKVMEAEATVSEAQKELARLERVRTLSNNKVPSEHELDAAVASLKRAQALKASAKAQVFEARAILEFNETDLAKAVIHSPINGIVLDRNVEPGQTVAASLQAPVLFTLAEDLARMELHVAVDEADVGHVKKGQEAVFTVDAYPDRRFPARIGQVRFGSQTVSGVVTYVTVLNVDNSDLLLRPGLTATADITVKKVEDAILVPNSALRFTPPVKEDESQSDGGGIVNSLLPRRPKSWKKQHREDSTARNTQQRVWVERDGKLVAVSVMTGATDGILTEIIEGDIEPGMAVVVDILEAAR